MEAVIYKTLSEIRTRSALRSRLAVPNSEVVQSASRLHGRIRSARLGVPEDILHDAGPFHSREGMLDSDSHARQLPVLSLLSRRELAAARLFFSPGGSASPPARTLGIPYPCTGSPPADRRCPPDRRSSYHAPCRRRSGSRSRYL